MAEKDPEMTTIQHFRDNLQSYTDACNCDRRAKYEEVTTFHDWQEFRTAARLLNMHAALCRAKTSGHTGTGQKQAIWMSYRLNRIEIRFEPRPREQNVRDTSRDAYRHIDHTTQEGCVLRCMVQHIGREMGITRTEIAHYLGYEKSTVSARVNALVSESDTNGGIVFDGVKYRIVEMDNPRRSLVPNAPEVRVIPLRVEIVTENAADAAQTTLF